MEINPFAVYLIKTAQLLCSALGMQDEHIFTPEQFTNQLVPKEANETIIREMNGIEIESCIMIWSVSGYVNTNARHKQWSPPTQKLILDLVQSLQKMQFWHLAEWIHVENVQTSQYWGLRRYQKLPYWVTREPTPQEKLQDGMQKLHEDLGFDIVSM